MKAGGNRPPACDAPPTMTLARRCYWLRGVTKSCDGIIRFFGQVDHTLSLCEFPAVLIRNSFSSEKTTLETSRFLFSRKALHWHSVMRATSLIAEQTPSCRAADPQAHAQIAGRECVLSSKPVCGHLGKSATQPCARDRHPCARGGPLSASGTSDAWLKSGTCPFCCESRTL